ncbi:PEP-CTERM sorting domain-containing protein [Myxococcota bacterium]|nr:PEP-CTERM sorting domain-containing protein [Myxococcota bacterium]
MLALLVSIGLLSTSSAWAQTVAISNHDFESPGLAAGSFTNAVPPGWTFVDGFPSETGVFHPTIGSWGYVAPSGNQLLYLNGTTVEQQLATNVVAGETYLLAVDVVRRPSFWNPAYRIDFFAGNVLLGSDVATLVPAVGGSRVSLLKYTAGSVDPAVGKALRVRLGGLTQTNFDDVRVYVPEPGVAIGLVVVAPMAALIRRRRGRW